MKYFWTLPAALRVALVLAAESHPFSINDDLLAYPQYEIHFDEEYILEEVARPKLKHNRSKLHKQSSEIVAEVSSAHIDRYKPPERTSSEYGEQDEHYYEEMTVHGVHYLCAIPDVVLEEESQRVNNTEAKLEQEKELVRANTRGWELMTGMRGNCVYYHVDWWSYSYCYDTGVRQFHMMPVARGVAPWPPLEDPNVPGFNLGVYDRIESSKKSSDVAVPKKGELEVKAGTRYLVQRLEGGDKCDLTTLRRKVEVQFHCNPGLNGDAISLIKEVSTCSYLMIIETPRLCDDVAFRPPNKEKPHNITCRPILAADQVEQYEEQLAYAMEEDTSPASAVNDFVNSHQWIGDVIVGARRIVPEGAKIEKSAIVGGKEVFVATIATSEGMQMAKAELDKLKLGDPKDIESFKERVKASAGDKMWRLDVVDTISGRQLRGIYEDGSDEKEPATDKAASEKESGKGTPPSDKEQAPDAGEGSEEEFYKEEL